MKKLITPILLLLCSQSHAFEVGGTRAIQCGPLTSPREQVEELYQVISNKLEECLQNKLQCEKYLWLQVTLKGGEKITSKTEQVNLWELRDNLEYALACDNLLKQNPGEPAGILEFSN